MGTSSSHYPTMGQGTGIPWLCCIYPALRLLPISGRSSPCDPVRRIADDSTRLLILPSSPFSHESGPAGCADCRDELPKTSLVQSSLAQPETTIAQEGDARMRTAYEAPSLMPEQAQSASICMPQWSAGEERVLVGDRRVDIYQTLQPYLEVFLNSECLLLRSTEWLSARGD